jgi:hypothetical protein
MKLSYLDLGFLFCFMFFLLLCAMVEFSSSGETATVACHVTKKLEQTDWGTVWKAEISQKTGRVQA